MLENPDNNIILEALIDDWLDYFNSLSFDNDTSINTKVLTIQSKIDNLKNNVKSQKIPLLELKNISSRSLIDMINNNFAHKEYVCRMDLPFYKLSRELSIVIMQNIAKDLFKNI